MASSNRTLASSSRSVIAALTLIFATGPVRSEDQPAPGTLVAVGDSRLHIDCVGAGRPAVVFEAGIGGNSLDWTLVQAIEAPRRMACAYDRPGAGWSERTGRLRTADVMADELHEVVRGAGIAEPFILAGHSFGGLLSQSYAARYPADIAGLVLVDSVHPNQDALFAAVGVDLPKDPHALLGATPPIVASYGLPTALQGVAVDLAEAHKARVFVVREFLAMPEIAADVRVRTLPRIATRVLVHGRPEWDSAYPDGRMERAWRSMQADLAARFEAPPPIVVDGAGHQIALDNPEAVADAIEAVARSPR